MNSKSNTIACKIERFPFIHMSHVLLVLCSIQLKILRNFEESQRVTVSLKSEKDGGVASFMKNTFLLSKITMN